MKYHLYENWNVTIDLKITHSGIKYSFRFNFIVSVSEKWGKIINTAKAIIEEKFGHVKYEITQISLTNED